MKILIVENEIFQAQNIKSQLIELGHQPTQIVRSGEEAIASVKKSPPDLVLMDIDLEGVLNGIETTEILNKTNHDLPIIYLSILEGEVIYKSILETNHLHFLPKPFNLSQLKKSLSYVEAKMTDQPQKDKPVLENYIFLKKNDLQFDRISLDDILWVEGGTNSITVVTINMGKYVLSGVFGPFTKKVNQPYLKRIHRSYMVNLKHVTGIKGNLLVVGKRDIPFTKTYVKNINELLQVIHSSKK